MTEESLDVLFANHYEKIPEEYLNISPVSEAFSELDALIKERIIQFGYPLDVWFDLDETLLCTDYIAKPPAYNLELKSLPHSFFPCWSFSMMKVNPFLWIKNRYRTGLRYCFSGRSYPFLRNPIIWSNVRPGAIGLLEGIKAVGGFVGLVTLSRRKRVNYFMRRLPRLFDSFDKVLCIDESLRFSSERGFDVKLNPCFKRPELLNSFSPKGDFDYLVDDSTLVASAYNNSNFSKKLIRVEPGDSFGQQLNTVAQKMFSSGPHYAQGPANFKKSEIALIEDPFYLPTLIRTESVMDLFIERAGETHGEITQ